MLFGNDPGVLSPRSLALSQTFRDIGCIHLPIKLFLGKSFGVRATSLPFLAITCFHNRTS